eukprot:8821924-Pyramimonas_sp.AAC.1
MSGVTFALKGKRKRTIMKEAAKTLKLEEDGANAEHVTHEMEGLNTQQRTEALEKLREQGSDLALEGKFGQALQIWDRILRIEADNAVVHELRAQVYLEMDQPWSAVQAATRLHHRANTGVKNLFHNSTSCINVYRHSVVVLCGASQLHFASPYPLLIKLDLRFGGVGANELRPEWAEALVTLGRAQVIH